MEWLTLYSPQTSLRNKLKKVAVIIEERERSLLYSPGMVAIAIEIGSDQHYNPQEKLKEKNWKRVAVVIDKGNNCCYIPQERIEMSNWKR